MIALDHVSEEPFMYSLENFSQTCLTGHFNQMSFTFAETELFLNCKWLLWSVVKSKRCINCTALDQMFSVQFFKSVKSVGQILYDRITS